MYVIVPKMCGNVGVKSPLDLATKLAENGKEADVELAKFIIENSDPESCMKSEKLGNYTPMHVAALHCLDMYNQPQR